MSALHWEARRRQSFLDRRMAADKQLLQRGASGTGTESNTTPEQAAGGQCPSCKAEMKAAAHHKAKIHNRYSSLQYNQQW